MVVGVSNESAAESLACWTLVKGDSAGTKIKIPGLYFYRPLKNYYLGGQNNRRDCWCVYCKVYNTKLIIS